MATRLSGGIIVGHSFEEKPSTAYDPDNPVYFVEQDTRRRYRLTKNSSGATRWVPQSQDQLIVEGEESFPLGTNIHEFGDNFPKTAPLAVHLLNGSVGDTMGNGDLILSDPTNTANWADFGAVPFEGFQCFDAGRNVTNTAGLRTAYKAASSFFGGNSFFTGAWFRSISQSGTQVMFSVGYSASNGALAKGLKVSAINSGDSRAIRVDVTDGTNSVYTFVNAKEFFDGRAYYLAVLFDQSEKKLTLFVGNKFKILKKAEQTFTTMNSIDDAGNYISLSGMRTNVNTSIQFFAGQLFNFHAYRFNDNTPDQAAIRMFMAGIADAPIKGVTATVQTGTTDQRFANNLRLEAAANDYVYYMFDTEEGVYDNVMLYTTDTNGARVQVYIDGALLYPVFTDTASASYNNISTRKEHLTKGIHFMKIKFVTGTTSAKKIFNMQSILFNKRSEDFPSDKHNGSSVVKIFGDTLTDRSGQWTGVVPTGTGQLNWFNQFTQSSTPALTDYLQGWFTVKEGLYQFYAAFAGHTNNADIDILIDDKVLMTAATNVSNTDYYAEGQIHLTKRPHKITIKRNTAETTNLKIILQSITGKLLEDHANDPLVEIYPSDPDDLASGSAAWTLNSPLSVSRFGARGQINGGSQSVSWYRQFAGGWYDLQVLSNSTGTAGSTQIFLDDSTTAMFSSSSGNLANGLHKLVYIPRGQHRIKLSDSGDAQSNTFVTGIFFHLIARADLPDDQPDIETNYGTHIGQIRIGYQRANKSVNIQAIKPEDDAKIIVLANPELTNPNAGGLCVIINGINSSSYDMVGRYERRLASPTLTTFRWTTTGIFYTIQELAENATTTKAAGSVEMQLQKASNGNKLHGLVQSHISGGGNLYHTWDFVGTVPTEINKLTMCTQASSMINPDSVFNIYRRNNS